MDNDLDLGRYTAGVRRHTRGIALTALIGLAAGLLYSWTAPASASVRLEVLPKLLELASVGVEQTNLDVDGVVEVVVGYINEDSFDALVSRAVGAAVDVSGQRVLERRAISIEVSADDVATVADASVVVHELARERYAAELVADTAQVRSSTVERSARVDERTAEIDSLLAEAGPDQRTLVEGLLVERQELRDENDRHDAVLAALDRFETTVSSDVQMLMTDEPARRSMVLLGVAGLLAGLALAFVASLCATALDRTVRSRQDLRRIGIEDLVAVVPDPPTELAVTTAGAAIHALAATLTGHQVQIVPIAPRADFAWSADLLNGGTNALVRAPLNVSSQAVASAADGVSVLAVEWGKDRRMDVARAVHELGAAGARHVAVLLWSVKSSAIGDVEA